MGRMSKIGVFVAIALLLSAALPMASTEAATCSDSGLCPNNAPLHIALMGDSYTAGNGAGNYVGPDGCYRSPLNWGSKVADHLQREGFAVDETNVACNKATTDAITSSQPISSDDMKSTYSALSGGVPSPDQVVAEMHGDCIPTGSGEVAELSDPVIQTWSFLGVTYLLKASATCAKAMQPQVDQLPSGTNLVFMTLGGNDIGFSNIVIDCFVAARAADIVRDFADDAADLVALLGGPLAQVQMLAFRAAISQLVPNLNMRCQSDIANAERPATRAAARAGLVDAVTAIRDQIGPSGEIVLVSYPYLDQIPDMLSNGYPVGRALKRIGDAGDRLEGQVAEDLDSSENGGINVRFVDDVKEVFSGHEPTGSAVTSNPDGYLWELPQIPGNAKNTLKRAAKRFVKSVYWGTVRGHVGAALADDGLSGLEKGFGPTIFSYYHPNTAGQSALAVAVENATDQEIVDRFCGAGTPLQLVAYQFGQPLGLDLVADQTVIVTIYKEESEEPLVYSGRTDAQGRLTIPAEFVGGATLTLDTGTVVGDGCEYHAAGSAELTGDGPLQTVRMEFRC